jgi:hypothetical protein
LRHKFLDVFLFGGADTFTADCLRLYTAFWEDLLPSEKIRIITLLEEHDPNNIFKAVVLTGKSCPEELSFRIVGKRHWQQMNGNEKAKTLKRDLLEKCMSIVYITHRYKELVNQDRKSWDLVLLSFLNKTSDVLSRLSIKLVLENAAHGSAATTMSDAELEKLLIGCIQNKGQREYVFDLMLEDLNETTCSNFEMLWNILFAHINESEKLNLRKRMAATIERIEMHDNIEIVLDLFGDDFLKEIPADGSLLIVMDQYRKHLAPSTEILAGIKTMIEGPEINSQLRLRRTYDVMRQFILDFLPNDKTLYDTIQTARHRYFERERAIEANELRDKVMVPFAALYIN